MITNRKQNPRADEGDDEDDDQVSSDIESILRERADMSLVTGLSTLGDQLANDLEDDGYDTTTALVIASNDQGTIWAVNGDLIVDGRELGLDPLEANGIMLWGEEDRAGRTPIDALMAQVNQSDLEDTGVGGEWPTGEEAEIDVDSVVEQAFREFGHSQATTVRVLSKLFKEPVGQLVYWRSSSGDTEIYAKRKVTG